MKARSQFQPEMSRSFAAPCVSQYIPQLPCPKFSNYIRRNLRSQIAAQIVDKPTFTLYARVQPFISICTSAQSAVESKQLRRSALRNSDARQVQRMMVMTQMVYCRISWRGYPMVSLGFKPNLPTSCSLSHASRCIAARSSGGDGWLCYAQCPCELRGLSGLMQPKPGFRNVCRVMIAGIWTAVQGQDYVWTDAVQAWQ